MNNLTLRQLRAFRAVAVTGSFTTAADHLHLTPAALSGLIKELESQLGLRVFDRSTRKVTLSAVGAQFFPLTERVLQDLDAAVSSVSNLKELRRGIVRLAAPEVMSCTLVPQAMAAFKAQHPDIELRFLDVPIEEVVARTARGEIDLGIAPGPVAPGEIERLPFMRAPLMLAVRRDDALARRARVSWDDVRQRPFVTFFRGFSEWAPSPTSRSSRSPHLGAQAESLFPKDVLFVRRINTALAMVQSGFGVSACPIYASDLAAGFGLKLIRVRPEIDREYALLQRAGHSLTPAAEAFRAFLMAFAPRWAGSAQRSAASR